MDGTPNTTSPKRSSNGPSSLPPRPKAPTIKDPLVLYQKGFISEAQLKAEISKSKEDAKAAYKEARALVDWTNSKAPPIPNGKKNSPTVKYSADEAEKVLINKYRAEGYQFIKNTTLTDSLITSLLKIFSNDFQTDHQAKVNTYREKLNTLLKNQNRTVLKYKDLAKDEHIHDIVKQMRKDTSLTFRDRAVEIWRANDKGEVVKFCIGSSTEKVILFQTENEFTAVIPPQKQNPRVSPEDSGDHSDSPVYESWHNDYSDNDNDNDNDNQNSINLDISSDDD